MCYVYFLHFEYNPNDQIVQIGHGISECFVSFFETFDESALETQNKAYCSHSMPCCFIKCMHFNVSIAIFCNPVFQTTMKHRAFSLPFGKCWGILEKRIERLVMIWQLKQSILVNLRQWRSWRRNLMNTIHP